MQEMIEKILNTESVNFYSDLSGDNLRQKMEDVFNRSGLDFVGEFTGQNEFNTFDKWTCMSWYMPNFKRKTAYLSGEMVKSGKGTLLKLKIKPNPILSILPILAMSISIIMLILARSNNMSVIFGLATMAVGILFYALGVFLTRRLRNNFKKYFNLKKV